MPEYVIAGWIAEVLLQERQHRIDNAGQQRGGGVVVQVDDLAHSHRRITFISNATLPQCHRRLGDRRATTGAGSA